MTRNIRWGMALLTAYWFAFSIVGCVPVATPTVDEPAGRDTDDDVECRSHADCDDGLFCNGRERCLGTRCEDGDRPCGNDSCDEAQNQCGAESPAAEPEPTPEPEPITNPTYLDVIRGECPWLSDAEISEAVGLMDTAWFSGVTLAEGYATNEGLCGVDTECLSCWDSMVEFVWLVYHEGENPPSVPPPVVLPPLQTESFLVAADGQFLGNVNDNTFDPDSIANTFGTYGSVFNSLSIWNRFGTYGSQFNSLSPWNSFATTPPCIVEDEACVLFVTANAFIQPSIHPNDLALFVGRTDVLR